MLKKADLASLKLDIDKLKIKDVYKKMPDTSKFIVTQDFNRLTKINFNARMLKASRNFAIKKQVENPLD